MSNRLLNEVWDCVLPGLTPSERLVLLAVADEVRDNKDKTNRGECVLTDALLCRKTGLSTEALRKTKQRLAARGLEVRVPVKDYDGTEQKDSKGRIVFAYEGRATRYSLPVLTPFSGGNVVPPLTPADDPENTSVVGTQSASGGNVVPQWREPVPTDSLETPNNPMPSGSSMSSLSPSVPRAPAQRGREDIMTWATREYDATTEEINTAWEYAKENGMTSKTAWLKSCPDDVAEQVRDIRQIRASRAAYEARAPVMECRQCRDPIRVPAGTDPLCLDCREKAA